MDNADDLGSVRAGLDDLFDDHGLLAGAVGARMWPQMCLRIEEDLEERGWDQPTQLLAVTNPVNTEASGMIEMMAAGQLASAAPGDSQRGDRDGESLVVPGIPFGVVKLGEFRGQPVSDLWGFTAPPWASALLLAFEGWFVPPLFDDGGNLLPDEHADLPASQHPRRGEQRHVLMLTRQGACYSAVRTRGDEEAAPDFTVPQGMLVDVLKRTLGLPTAPPPTTAADLLGRLALAAAANAVASLTRPETEQETRLRRTGGNNPQDRSAASAAAWASSVREDLAALRDDDRREMLEIVFSKSLLASVAHVAWKVTDHGERGIPKPQRRLVRDLATNVEFTPEHLEALRVAAGAAADLSFTDIVAGKRAREMFPAEMTNAAPGWADDGIVARRLCWRELPSQPALRDGVARMLGQMPPHMEHLLGSIGWGSDAPAGPDDEQPAANGHA